MHVGEVSAEIRTGVFDVLSGAAEATCIANPGMEVLWINPAMEHLASISAGDAKGSNVLRFLADRVLLQADEPSAAAILSSIRSRTEEGGIECRIGGPEGEAWYAYTSRRLERGTLAGAWILTFREITAQKRTAREHERCSGDLVFLSRAATGLAALPPDAEIFAVIGGYIHELAPDSIVIVSEADVRAGTLTPRAFFGIEYCLPRVAAFLDRDITGITLNIPENIREIMAHGEIAEIEGGLEAVALWQIPGDVCRKIEEIAGFGAMYCVPFTWKGEIFGTAVILTRGEDASVPFEAIDTFKDLASIALQRHLAEDRLRRSEERFRALIEKSSDFILIVDDQVKIRFASPPIERIDGISPQMLVGRSAFDMMLPEEVPRAQELMSRLMKKPGSSAPLEVRFRGPRGLHVIEAMVTNLLDDPQVRGVVVNARDITKRKRAEEALRQAERDMALILNSTAEMFTYYDTDLRVLWANRAAAAFVGREPKDLVGRFCYEVWHNRTGACEGCPVVLVRETGEPHEAEITTPDGRMFFLRGYPVTDESGRVIGLIEFGQDITGQKRAQEAIRAANAYNRSLIEANLDPLVTIGPDGRITDVNAATEAATGYARDELIGTDFSDYFTDPGEARAGYRKAFAEGQVRDYPLEIRHRDGYTTPVLYNATVYRDEEGNVTGVFAAARDITERKQAEEALQRRSTELAMLNRLISVSASTHSLDELLESALATSLALLSFDLGAVYLLDREHSRATLATLRGIEQPLGLQTLDVSRHPFDEVFVAGRQRRISAGETNDETEKKILDTFAAASLLWIPLMAESRIMGALVLGSLAGRQVPPEDRWLTEAISREIGAGILRGTLYKQLETANREANLYLDILTHDIRNVNSVATMYTDLLAEILEGEERTYVLKMKSSIDKSTEILANVATIRKIHEERAPLKPIDLQSIIVGEQKNFPDTVIRYAGQPRTVWADDLLPEVFNNLIGNAVKFGGPDVIVMISVETIDDGVVVTVADTGPGIPDDLKEAIFHRFERGQTRARGEGLGLYICHKLLERYGGRIWVEDRVPGHPEMGAALRFTLKEAVQ